MRAAVALTAAETKHFATLQARAALLGAVLEASSDDRDRPLYVLTRGAWTTSHRSLADVEAWLRLRAWVIERTGAAS